ncbi:unnamed protein product, partial [Rotaria sordida]
MVDHDIIGFHSDAPTIADEELTICRAERVLNIATAIRQGYTIERLFDLTKIDRWYLYKFEAIIKFIVEHSRPSTIKNKFILREAKHLGFSDQQIVKYSGITELKLRALYDQYGIRPFRKQIDTLSGPIKRRRERPETAIKRRLT